MQLTSVDIEDLLPASVTAKCEQLAHIKLNVSLTMIQCPEDRSDQINASPPPHEMICFPICVWKILFSSYIKDIFVYMSNSSNMKWSGQLVSCVSSHVILKACSDTELNFTMRRQILLNEFICFE